MRVAGGVGLALAGVLAISACAVRLGGPGPEDYGAIALRAGGDAAVLGRQLRDQGADLVLLVSAGDSAWFAAVAQHANLKLSGPGTTGGTGLALMSRLKLLGDTSHVEPVGTDTMHMQDALYEISRDRHLDLMLVRLAPSASVQENVRVLLNYIATDVGGAAALLLALETPTAAAADSAGLLLRAAFEQVNDCRGRGPGEAAAGQTLRLFYGPTARIDCEGARLLADPSATLARVRVGG